MTRRIRLLAIIGLLGACVPPVDPRLPNAAPSPLGEASFRAPATTQTANPRGIDPGAPILAGPATQPAAPTLSTPIPGDITLDFADTDIREVTAQILGRLLGLTYVIDPAVRGSVSFRSAEPLTRAQLLPALRAMLAQNGAGMVQTDGLIRVTPSLAAGGPAGAILAGSVVVPLRHAVAEDLARVLQPFVGTGGRIVAEPGRNALIIATEADTQEALVAMARAFDVDSLAGQSYALFPVVTGGVKEFAIALQDAFRGQAAGPEAPRGGLASLVRVVPMERINAVLVVASQPRYIEEARRVHAVVDRARRQTLRSWHVTYLRNSDANDAAFTMQSAFTPNNVTAQPRGQTGSPFPQGGGGQRLGANQNQGQNAGVNGGQYPGQNLGQNAGLATQAPQSQQPGLTAPPPNGVQSAPAGNPLLGGLDPLGGANQANPETLRIIPNEQNNALLIYATAPEHEMVAAMLRKLDILPRQVRIDATIAEVTLNDQLQYGTQFFFRAGGINGILSFANAQNTNPQQAGLASQFPGFFLGGRGLGGAPFALNALQSVTTVNVLSSPQLMVLDNQQARLQVGNLVPYLAQTSQSTIAPGAPVINSINYQQTGVIMQIRPRINAGGLVTLDISQEVSDVNPDSQIPGITSPTFLERNVSSRVVVQDGQTIGLAGLIRDSSSRGNEGLPWLKDIPVLGLLAGKQDNTRGRTELLILITPHVIEDHRDARALTEDLREQLGAAAAVPALLRGQRASGSNDPGAPVRQKFAPRAP